MIYVITDGASDSIAAAQHFITKYGVDSVVIAEASNIAFNVKIYIKDIPYDRSADYIALINTMPPINRYDTALAELNALHLHAQIIWIDTDHARINAFANWFNHAGKSTQYKGIIQGTRQRGGDIIELTRKYLQLPSSC